MAKTKRPVQIADMPDMSVTLGDTPRGTKGHRAAGAGPDVAQERLAKSGDDAVRHRAYALYCERGCGEGFDVDDWCQAERELRSLVATV
jgi:hypothetical protein